jgi:hypothetical protein
MSRAANVELLLRGDQPDAVSVPDPNASNLLIRHILYVDGYGRQTPYLSTSELREIAELWGVVWETPSSLASSHGATHIRKDELLSIIRVSRRGRAGWPRRLERLQAMRYVEDNHEHLLDYTAFRDRPAAELTDAVKKTFSRSRK